MKKKMCSFHWVRTELVSRDVTSEIAVETKELLIAQWRLSTNKEVLNFILQVLSNKNK